jgi:hypothetical protein
VVRRIDALFEIERDINGLVAAERRAVRQDCSVPLLADLQACCVSSAPSSRELPP